MAPTTKRATRVRRHVAVNPQFVQDRLRTLPVSKEVHLDFEFVQDALIAETMAIKEQHRGEAGKEQRRARKYWKGTIAITGITIAPNCNFEQRGQSESDSKCLNLCLKYECCALYLCFLLLICLIGF